MCKASKDDACASKEKIFILRKEIRQIQKEKETLSTMHPKLAESQLMNMLKEKVEKLVELESSQLEREKAKQILDEKMSKLDKNAAEYLQLIEVKDQSILRISNLLHELETSSYAKNVTVGTQCESDQEEVALKDTVTAFLMQNKLLNKEVLELNKLRQLAIGREQKLFFEAGDWEAKFHQTQSKYLLLLIDLHNQGVRKANI